MTIDYHRSGTVAYLANIFLLKKKIEMPILPKMPRPHEALLY